MPVMGALQRFMLRNSLPSYMVNSWYTEDGIKQAR